MSHAGSRPSSARAKAIIPVVVVLPCAPATTIERRSETSSARKAAREVPGTAAYALETTASHPSGTTGTGAISTWMPSSRRRYGVSTRSQPPTSAPQARARKAYDERPAPPMPTNQSRLPSSKRDQLLRDFLSRLGPGHRPHRRAHRVEPGLVGEQLVHEQRHAIELGLRHHDRAAAALEVARVQGLVVGGRMGIRDEDRRRPRGGELPHRAAR